MRNFKIGRLRKKHQNLLEKCIHHRELLTYKTLPELFMNSIRIREFLQQQKEQKKTMSFSIENEKELAGVALFHNLDFEERQGQLSILMMREIEAKAIEELFVWIIEYGFSEINLHRIYGYVRVDKTAFVPIIENCGLMREAQIRHAIFSNGEYGDLYLYSILNNNSQGKMEKS